MILYPLKFQPIFQYRIWAGEKLKTVLNKDYDDDCIGESWEISTVPNNETLIVNGPLKGKTINELIAEYKEDFLGEKVFQNFGIEFPLLIKFIDAKTALSIQVHPDDKLAKERHNSFGKNEMWYVMESDDDAELIIGFNEELDKESYSQAIEKGEIEAVLNTLKAKEGDTFFIPAGRVHAIGAGVLIAEIQQTSDVTYRIFDFNRVDSKTGKKRELHTDLSVDAINFDLINDYKTNYSQDKPKAKLVHTDYFKTNILNVEGTVTIAMSRKESFKILICTDGVVTIECGNIHYSIKKGETILLPAGLKESVNISSTNAKVLEVYL